MKIDAAVQCHWLLLLPLLSTAGFLFSNEERNCSSKGEPSRGFSGIGVITAGVIIGELLPVARLADEGQCATYAGLTPLSRQTGKGENRRRIARGVNKRVLHALYTSAVASIGSSAMDRAYFEKKVRDYSGHPKPTVAAFIALARKRHQVIYRLMTTNERYDKEKLISSHLARLDQARLAAA